MKVGLIVTSYNRPHEYAQCLESLSRCTIPKEHEITILLVDDYSTDDETLNLWIGFKMQGAKVFRLQSNANLGIREQLKAAFDYLFHLDFNLVINLDGDAIVKQDFFEKLINLKLHVGEHIVTGFNSINRNRNGSERHPILVRQEHYWMKSSVGGINMVIDKSNYEKWVRPALEVVGNWDANTCINSMRDGFSIACLVPSVVQHLATKSSMGHTEEPDVACDFEMQKLQLPMVTLIGVDTTDTFAKLKQAEEICKRQIDFAESKMLTTAMRTGDPRLQIANIPDKESYSRFVIKELYKHFDTDFALIIQFDGYIVNANAWTDEFLEYDYIGATWWFKDRRNVGNGGFSLRSKKLMEILAHDELIKVFHPEDTVICREMRPYLEKHYGIKFAPEELANLFSIEAFNSVDRQYSGQFGFHGMSVDFTKSTLQFKPTLHVDRRKAIRRR